MKITELKRDIEASLTEDGYESSRVFRCSPVGSEILKGDQVLFEWPRSIGYTHPIFLNIGITEITSKMEDTNVLVTEKYGLSERTSQQNRFGEEWVWDLTAQMTRITAVTDPALQVHYPFEEPATPQQIADADIGTAIGWDGERVEGVSVYRPTLSLKVTKHFEKEDLDSVIKTSHSIHNSTNIGVWKFYQEGEVLFSGASIRQKSPDDWVVDYRFLISKQQGAFDLTLINESIVEDVIVGPWQYGWGLNTQKTVSGKTKNGIESFHVATVYGKANLSNLGLLGP